MKIDLIFPVLPPTLDGIGDHTAHLARALATEGCTVRVLTAQEEWTPLRGLEVQRAFHLQQRRGISELIDAYRSRPQPDWLLLQFEQFSYGRWGLNPFLPLALRQIKRIAPATKIAVMFHEDYMPAHSIKSAIMSSWQRVQFRMLGHLADVAFFSTEPWARTYAQWFPDTAVHHLPVGSNIPRVETDRTDERARLGIAPETVVIGLFGSAHPSRLLAHVDAALKRCLDHALNVQLLYVGPQGAQVRETVSSDVPLSDAGPLPAAEVAHRFAAMDVYLAPFKLGVSTRRGSFLVGLQQGVATVTTCGPETGPLLSGIRDQAFMATPNDQADRFAEGVIYLVQDLPERQRLAKTGSKLFKNHFAWSIIAERLRSTLCKYSEV
jgi:glycosyltransferase involved in cell wall biosynthesis